MLVLIIDDRRRSLFELAPQRARYAVARWKRTIAYLQLRPAAQLRVVGVWPLGCALGCAPS